MPIRTIIDRLTHDGDISRAQAYALAPAVYVINAIEWLRRRSDALVVLAQTDLRWQCRISTMPPS